MAERRQLGLAAATAAVTGQSIALGIFLTPATMAKSLGSPLLLGAVWCAMAVVMVCGALCYAELAVRFPEAGGEYVYLREGYGGRAAFLYGWMTAAIVDPGLAAALAVGSVAYVQTLMPLHPTAMALLPAAILLCLAVVNFLGTRLSGGLMAAANLLKIAVLVGLAVWAITLGGGSLENLLPLAERRAGSEPLFPAIAGAVVSAFFSFGGWWEAGKLAGEIRDPEKNLPRAFTGGVLLVTGVYLLISFAFLYVLPLEEIVSNTAFVSQFGGVLFGSAGAKVLSVCVLLSVLGGLQVLTMAAPRAYYAMARDGARRRLLSGLCPPASAIRHAGSRHPSAYRPGPGRSHPWSLRPDPGVRHLFRGRVSRPFGDDSLPAATAHRPVVVSGGSDPVRRRVRRDRAVDPAP